MYRTDFWTLWEKVTVGCSERITLRQVYYQGWNRSPAQAGCMRQVLRAGALGRPRGMGWGGKQEEGVLGASEGQRVKTWWSSFWKLLVRKKKRGIRSFSDFTCGAGKYGTYYATPLFYLPCWYILANSIMYFWKKLPSRLPSVSKHKPAMRC